MRSTSCSSPFPSWAHLALYFVLRTGAWSLEPCGSSSSMSRPVSKSRFVALTTNRLSDSRFIGRYLSAVANAFWVPRISKLTPCASSACREVVMLERESTSCEALQSAKSCHHLPATVTTRAYWPRICPVKCRSTASTTPFAHCAKQAGGLSGRPE